ncbi:hypothetical protein J3R30DRAFT_2395423 [Lentinula aciculospora]|uniref:Uncharacterized protein n=1 Tax=Lentinula aciculospora TaxID=153920 RepID=A0A9W9AEN4_9AGAR|nr:hypothetical protein J3R30DRAFT_2395423 [Lentinula aciculospora]
MHYHFSIVFIFLCTFLTSLMFQQVEISEVIEVVEVYILMLSLRSYTIVHSLIFAFNNLVTSVDDFLELL